MQVEVTITGPDAHEQTALFKEIKRVVQTEQHRFFTAVYGSGDDPEPWSYMSLTEDKF